MAGQDTDLMAGHEAARTSAASRRTGRSFQLPRARTSRTTRRFLNSYCLGASLLCFFGIVLSLRPHLVQGSWPTRQTSPWKTSASFDRSLLGAFWPYPRRFPGRTIHESSGRARNPRIYFCSRDQSEPSDLERYPHPPATKWCTTD